MQKVHWCKNQQDLTDGVKVKSCFFQVHHQDGTGKRACIKDGGNQKKQGFCFGNDLHSGKVEFVGKLLGNLDEGFVKTGYDQTGEYVHTAPDKGQNTNDRQQNGPLGRCLR